MKSAQRTSNLSIANRELGHARSPLAGPEAGIVFRTRYREIETRARSARVSADDSAGLPLLIAGASPAGLIAAIRLREEGVDVRVFDRLPADGMHCFPTVLHPRTLRLLSSVGVAAPLLWRGHDVARLAVYMEGRRHAVLDLPSGGERGPATMTLPEDVLRRVLLRRLYELGTRVEWQTRLVALQQDPTRVRVRLVRRERANAKRSRLEPEWLDVAVEDVEAQFVIGADGTQSSVRQLLGIEWLAGGRAQFYITYETPDPRAGNEAQLVVHEGFGNTIYPFQSGVSRFTFAVDGQLSSTPEVEQLRQLLESRMPWYSAEVERFEWIGQTTVNPGVAARFGMGRVWLTGDAAHSNVPLGGQNLNIGMLEANHLALRIVDQIAGRGDLQLDVPHTGHHHFAWQIRSACYRRVPGSEFDSINRNIGTVLSSLPASGDDLDDLFDQLHQVST